MINEFGHRFIGSGHSSVTNGGGHGDWASRYTLLVNDQLIGPRSKVDENTTKCLVVEVQYMYSLYYIGLCVYIMFHPFMPYLLDFSIH